MRRSRAADDPSDARSTSSPDPRMMPVSDGGRGLACAAPRTRAAGHPPRFGCGNLSFYLTAICSITPCVRSFQVVWGDFVQSSFFVGGVVGVPNTHFRPSQV